MRLPFSPSRLLYRRRDSNPHEHSVHRFLRPAWLPLHHSDIFSDPGRIRTFDLQFRKLLLLSAELQGLLYVRRDSNSHIFRYWLLRPAWLPLHHERICDSGGIRTHNLPVRSGTLFHLSYRTFYFLDIKKPEIFRHRVLNYLL